MSRTVKLEHAYATSKQILFEAIRDGTVFRLTGAQSVDIDFLETGAFRLVFSGNRCIHGKFITIKRPEQVAFSWNVTGFREVADVNTLVTFSIMSSGDLSVLQLTHEGIETDESFSGKSAGWQEVLRDLGPLLEGR